MAKRASPCECRGSGRLNESGSANTVLASSKATPCLAAFADVL